MVEDKEREATLGNSGGPGEGGGGGGGDGGEGRTPHEEEHERGGQAEELDDTIAARKQDGRS